MYGFQLALTAADQKAFPSSVRAGEYNATLKGFENHEAIWRLAAEGKISPCACALTLVPMCDGFDMTARREIGRSYPGLADG